jgi:hypothetical protein
MASSFAGRKNPFNAVVEGAGKGFDWHDLNYKVVHLQIPPSAVLLDDLKNTYLLYAKTRGFGKPEETGLQRGCSPTSYKRPSDFRGLVKTELPKGNRAVIPKIETLVGVTLTQQEEEPSPEIIAVPRLIIMRDGRVFLAKKNWKENPLENYENSILDSVDEARYIFNSEEYAEAWDLL